MKRIKNMTALLLSALMVCAVSGCSGSVTGTKEVTADTREDAKKLVDEFYGDLTEANPVEMTTTFGGTLTGVFTLDGENMKQEDKLNGNVFYLITENGKKYYLSAEGEPSEEEYTYDLYRDTINLSLKMYVTGWFEEEDTESLKYNAVEKTTTENGKTESELQVTVSAEENGETAAISSTGYKTDGKVTKIEVSLGSGEQTMEYVLDFRYDGISVDLPEYTIVDNSQYLHHVDSPYATFLDAQAAAGEEGLAFLYTDGSIYSIIQKDGKFYQLAAEMTEEQSDAYMNLDAGDDDYSEKVNALVNPLTITDCVDFTELVLSDEEKESCKGKTIGELAEDGFEQSGWSIWDEGSLVYLSKNDIVYEVDVTLPEGFDTEADFEFEDLYGATVNSIVFSDVNPTIFPME